MKSKIKEILEKFIKLHIEKRMGVKKSQADELKLTASRAKRRREIKAFFKIFFKDVQILKRVGADNEIVLQCSGLYLDYDNPHPGNMFRFKTNRDAARAVCQCLYLCHFRKYGITVQPTREAYGEFLFYVHNAYWKGGKR